MIRTAVRELRAHAPRVILTVLTIALGVAFVVGSWVMGDSVQRARTGELRADFDVLVGGAEGTGLSDQELAKVGSLGGVAKAVGVVRGNAAVLGRGGKVIGSGQFGGTSWQETGDLQLTGGRAPRGPAEVALNERTARDAGYELGARAGVILDQGGRRELTVVGLFAYRPMGLDIAPGVAFDPATARDLLGGYTRIEVTAAAGVEVHRLTGELAAALPTAYLMTRAELAAEIRQGAAEEAAEVRAFLLGFAALTLLVGAFLIMNTFAVLATARIRQYALLRAVGASPRQIRRGVVLEAALLGLLGSSIGAALGVGFGYAAVQLLRPSGEFVDFAVSPVAVLAGYAVGVAATIAAAYGSARRSAAVAPMVALRADPRVSAPSHRGRRRTGPVLLLGGLAAVLATAGQGLSEAEMLVATGGAVSMLLGVLVLTPVLLPWALRPLDRLAARRGATEARLALRNAARDPRRSAATASAILIGIALVSAVATVGASTTSDRTNEIRAAVPSSTVVVGANDSGDSLGPDAVVAARGVPGRGSVVASRVGSGVVELAGGEQSVVVTGIDQEGLGTVIRPPMARGRADVIGGAMVSLRDAEWLGVDVGDPITVRVGEGDRAVRLRVPVTGLYQDSSLLYGVLIAESSVVAALPERYRAIYLGPAPGGTTAALRAATERAFAGLPDAVVTDVHGLIDREVAEQGLDFALLYGLLLAAILIAVAGVVNTMVLAVRERTDEIGLLRAVGATPRLVRRVVRLEALVLCCAGGVLAVAIGLPVGAVFAHVSLDRPLWRFTVPWSMLAAVLVGMVLVAVLAAAWPARRAARTGPLVC